MAIDKITYNEVRYIIRYLTMALFYMLCICGNTSIYA